MHALGQQHLDHEATRNSPTACRAGRGPHVVQPTGEHVVVLRGVEVRVVGTLAHSAGFGPREREWYIHRPTAVIAAA